MSAARSTQRLFLAAVLLACFAPAVRGTSSQISRPAVAVISGRVVDAVTGRPVRGATVGVTGVRGYTPGFFTGGDGRFQFSDAPIGQLQLNVTKIGFHPGTLGQRRPGGEGTDLNVVAGGTLSDIEIRIWPMSRISGRVIDEFDQPLAGVTVSCAPAAEMSDDAWPRATVLAVTDNAGVYLFEKLLAGDYIVGVSLEYRSDPDGLLYARPQPSLVPASGTRMRSPLTNDSTPTASARRPNHTLFLIGARLPPEIERGGQIFGYTSAYFPATPLWSQAAPIGVGPGEERTEINLTLPLRPAFEVSGVVLGADGAVAATQLTLAGPQEISTHALADGSFVFPVVPSGVYELRALVDSGASHTPPPELTPADRRWARQSVVVGNGNVERLAVALRPGIVVRGRLEFDATPPPSGDAIADIQGTVLAAGLVATSGNLKIAANGSFASSPMMPGRYTIRLSNLPDGWVHGSVEVRGRDQSDVPFDATGDVGDIVLRLFQRPAAVAGTVRVEGAGNSLPPAAVMLWPADRSAWGASEWSLKTIKVRVSRGRYEATNLAPGDYLIRAVDDGELTGWPAAHVVERLAAGAELITLVGGARLERALVVRTR